MTDIQKTPHIALQLLKEVIPLIPVGFLWFLGKLGDADTVCTIVYPNGQECGTRPMFDFIISIADIVAVILLAAWVLVLVQRKIDKDAVRSREAMNSIKGEIVALVNDVKAELESTRMHVEYAKTHGFELEDKLKTDIDNTQKLLGDAHTLAGKLEEKLRTLDSLQDQYNSLHSKVHDFSSQMVRKGYFDADT